MEDVDWEWIGFSLIQSFFKCSASLAISNNWMYTTKKSKYWILYIFEQPERFRYSRELMPNMLLGTLTRFLQSFKFKTVSFLRKSMDGSICLSCINPSRFILSRLMASPKFCILISFWEWERSTILKLRRGCNSGPIGGDKVNNEIRALFCFFS